ncbi:MAG: hypothetical protein RB191_23685 [Terriglobia bacterium]|nr:hypothetical protein [Terriglobia bacterium]
METLVKGFGAICLFVAAILFISPLAAAFGWLAGWTVGLFFGDTILKTLAVFGVHGVTMPQIGMTLGFIGGFLRTTVSKS